jgi:hypothetical protein
MSGQHHALAALYPQGKSPHYPLCRRPPINKRAVLTNDLKMVKYSCLFIFFMLDRLIKYDNFMCSNLQRTVVPARAVAAAAVTMAPLDVVEWRACQV